MEPSPPTVITATTRIQSKTSRILNWIIQDFESKYPEGTTEFVAIESPEFMVEHFGFKSWWYLRVDAEEGILRYIFNLGRTEPQRIIKRGGIEYDFQLWLGNETQSTLYQPSEEKSKPTPFLRTLIPLADLYNRRNELLVGGALRIRVLLEIAAENVTTEMSTSVLPNGSLP